MQSLLLHNSTTEQANSCPPRGRAEGGPRLPSRPLTAAPRARRRSPLRGGPLPAGRPIAARLPPRGRPIRRGRGFRCGPGLAAEGRSAKGGSGQNPGGSRVSEVPRAAPLYPPTPPPPPSPVRGGRSVPPPLPRGHPRRAAALGAPRQPLAARPAPGSPGSLGCRPVRLRPEGALRGPAAGLQLNRATRSCPQSRAHLLWAISCCPGLPALSGPNRNSGCAGSLRLCGVSALRGLIQPQNLLSLNNRIDISIYLSMLPSWMFSSAGSSLCLT